MCRVHGHGGHGGFISNHYRDIRTGGIHQDRPRQQVSWRDSSRQETAQDCPVLRRGAGHKQFSIAVRDRASTGTSRVFRGYGTRPSAGTRSSAFEHSRNSRFERAASDRGFQSRSNAGRVLRAGRGGGGQGGVSRSVPRRASEAVSVVIGEDSMVEGVVKGKRRQCRDGTCVVSFWLYRIKGDHHQITKGSEEGSMDTIKSNNLFLCRHGLAALTALIGVLVFVFLRLLRIRSGRSSNRRRRHSARSLMPRRAMTPGNYWPSSDLRGRTSYPRVMK